MLATLFGPDGFGLEELHVLAGLALVAAGFWWLPELQIRAGALFVPGFVLLWIGVPMRAPFVERPPVATPRRRERT